MLTFERANFLISYDPSTGILSRRKSHGRAKKGNITGCKNDDGYLVVSIDNKNYPAHRIAWLIHTGKLPKNQIDHINGIKDDNRIVNLREATNSENKKNLAIGKSSTTRIKGITWHKQAKKWRALICYDNKLHHLGLFDNILDAMSCYEKAAIETHKQFANLESHHKFRFGLGCKDLVRIEAYVRGKEAVK